MAYSAITSRRRLPRIGRREIRRAWTCAWPPVPIPNVRELHDARAEFQVIFFATSHRTWTPRSDGRHFGDLISSRVVDGKPARGRSGRRSPAAFRRDLDQGGPRSAGNTRPACDAIQPLGSIRNIQDSPARTAAAATLFAQPANGPIRSCRLLRLKPIRRPTPTQTAAGVFGPKRPRQSPDIR